MTDEQKQRKLEANRAYRERQRLKKSPKQPLFKSTPNPDLESAWKRVQDGKIEPLSEKQAADYVSNREKAEAVMAESVARLEAVNILFAKYSRSTNLPELLQGIIRELITLRVTLTDLIGGRK